jgi:hypothetical protein
MELGGNNKLLQSKQNEDVDGERERENKHTDKQTKLIVFLFT